MTTPAPGPDQRRREHVEDVVSALRYVADGIDPYGGVQILLDDYDERGLAVERLQNEVDVLNEYYEGETSRLSAALRAMARRCVGIRSDSLGMQSAAEFAASYQAATIARLRGDRDELQVERASLRAELNAQCENFVDPAEHARLTARLAEVEAENDQLRQLCADELMRKGVCSPSLAMIGECRCPRHGGEAAAPSPPSVEPQLTIAVCAQKKPHPAHDYPTDNEWEGPPAWRCPGLYESSDEPVPVESDEVRRGHYLNPSTCDITGDPHRWGTGRDRDECTDCDAPRWIADDGRDRECVARWPECHTCGYDPRCCRFPKSCRCDV